MNIFKTIIQKHFTQSFLLIPLLLCSCTHPIDGQVFVVTKSADNVKLGLVPIYLLNQEQFDNLHLQIKNNASKMHDKKLSDLQDKEAKKNDLTKQHNDLDQEYISVENSYLNSQKAIENMMGRNWSLTYPYLNSTENREILRKFVVYKDDHSSFYESTFFPDELVKNLSDVLQTGQNSTTDANVVVTNLNKCLDDYKAKIKPCWEDLEKYEHVRSRLAQKGKIVSKDLDEATSNFEQSKENINFKDEEIIALLKDALNGTEPATKTDADGLFTIKDIGKNQYIIALSERTVSDSKEYYCWMIDTKKSLNSGDNKHLLLSNDNLAGLHNLLE